VTKVKLCEIDQWRMYLVKFEDGSEIRVSDKNIRPYEGTLVFHQPEQLPAQEIPEQSQAEAEAQFPDDTQRPPEGPRHHPRRGRCNKTNTMAPPAATEAVVQKADELGMTPSEYISCMKDQQIWDQKTPAATTAGTCTMSCAQKEFKADPAAKPSSPKAAQGTGIFSRCWNNVSSYKWYVGATLGVALAIPFLFGMNYNELPSFPFFQSSEGGKNTNNKSKSTAQKGKTDPSASWGLTKPQWGAIAGVASIVGYGGYSMLCSSKPTGVAPEENRGMFSSSDQSGTQTSFWQKHGLTIGLIIIFLIGLGLVLSLVLGGDSQYDDHHRDDLEWGSRDKHRR